MPNTAFAEELQVEQRPEKHQLVLVVKAETPRSRMSSDIVEVVGLALIVVASWFIAALLLVPQLSGLL